MQHGVPLRVAIRSTDGAFARHRALSSRARVGVRTMSRPPRVGISSCLLGEKVRWDGGHKRDALLISELGRFVEWLPVCPEVEVGMGIPRPSVRLVRDGDDVRMLENETDRDHTRAMRAFAKRRVAEIAKLDLCGYVLKKDSPSCGMERVEVYRAGAPALRDGRGLFAQALLAALPSLPVEEEGA